MRTSEASERRDPTAYLSDVSLRRRKGLVQHCKQSSISCSLACVPPATGLVITGGRSDRESVSEHF